MKFLHVAFVAVLVFGASNAFLTDSISNFIQTGSNLVNGALFGGQFLWDNAISPSLQVLQNNSIEFIDNYFGNALSWIGKRSSDNLKSTFLEITTDFISKLKTIFLNFVARLKLQLAILYPSMVQAPSTSEIVAGVAGQSIKEVVELFDTTYQSLKEQFASQPDLFNHLINNLNGIKDTVLGAINHIANNITP